jgi:hypothetical protein
VASFKFSDACFLVAMALAKAQSLNRAKQEADNAYKQQGVKT